MEILTETASGNGVTFSWDRRLTHARGDSVHVRYDRDISAVPRHLLNLMFGVLMGEMFAWDGHDITFDELTRKEVGCLNDIVRLVRAVNTAGLARGLPDIRIGAKKMAADSDWEDSGPVLAANGMGKDGLTLMALLKEIGADFRCFTVAGQYKSQGLFEEIHSHIKECYRSRSVSDNIIETDFCQAMRYHTIPWWAFAIPLCHTYKTKTVLFVGHIGESKFFERTMLPCWPLSNAVTLRRIERAVGIEFNSPVWGLSDFGVQRLLNERYPELTGYQHSCMGGFRPCNLCGKCKKTQLWFDGLGHGPHGKELGLKADWSNLKGNHANRDCIDNVRLKVEGKPHAEWIDRLTFGGYLFSWQHPTLHNRLDGIVLEHFDWNEDDPGADGHGLMTVPRQWERLSREIWGRV